MKSNTILYIGFFSLPDHDAAAHRVLNNAKAFRRLGHTVIFIDEQKNNPYCSLLDSRHEVDGFVVYSQNRPNGIVQFAEKMLCYKSISTIVDTHQIELVIAYNYPAIALDRLRRFLKRKRIKIAADCTEWYSGREYSFPLSILAFLDSEFRMRVVHKKMDGIIAISHFLENYYNRLKTVRIPPLIDYCDSIWHQPAILFDESCVNLIYTGNPGRKKDILVPIIDAVSDSETKCMLRVVGISESEAKQRVKKINHAKVIFVGRVSHSETIKYLLSSDALVFYRGKNRVSMAGFSTKFVEAVTCGTAVITNDTSDMKSYMQSFDIGTIADSKQALLELLESDTIKKRIENSNSNKEGNEKLFDYNRYLNDFAFWVDTVMKEL